jgi:hypothetical protein
VRRTRQRQARAGSRGSRSHGAEQRATLSVLQWLLRLLLREKCGHHLLSNRHLLLLARSALW